MPRTTLVPVLCGAAIGLCSCRAAHESRAVDACEGAGCSGHGVCEVLGIVAFCSCDDGFVPYGLECIEGNSDAGPDGSRDAGADAEPADPDAGPDPEAGPGDGGSHDGGPGDGDLDADQAPEAGPADADEERDAEPDCRRRTYYEDRDGDGYGSDETVRECYEPSGFVGIAGDCDDTNPLIHPNTPTASSEPYTPPGSTEPSFDYDCDGEETRVTPEWVGACNTVTEGWANGLTCLYSSDVGGVCSYDAVLGEDLPLCGASYLECNEAGSGYTWSLVGQVECR